MENKQRWNEFAVASLTFGILAFIQIGGLEKAIAAVVFGILGLKKISTVEARTRGEGLAAAGIVLGIIYAVIAAIAVALFIKNPALFEQMIKRPLPK